MTPEAFRQYLHAQVTVYGSQKALAEALGVGESFLSNVLRGWRDPGVKIVEALGFRKVVSYEPVDQATASEE